MPITVEFPSQNSVQLNQPILGTELFALYPPARPAVAMRVNHYLRPLSWQIDADAAVTPVDTSTFEGVWVYRNTLSFALIMACHRALGKGLTVRHSISDALYWVFNDGTAMTPSDVASIDAELRRLVAADMPIQREILSLDKVVRIFNAQGKQDTAKLLALTAVDPVEVYRSADLYCCFYGPLMPSMGELDRFSVEPLEDGLALRFPTVASPDGLPAYTPLPKVSRVFSEFGNWLKTIGVTTMADLFDVVNSGGDADVVLLAEALHSQRFAQLAEEIVKDPERRMVAIAGPSSAGKTTSAQRLKIQLRITGALPVTLSLDDYYLDEITTVDEHGEPDFESIEALDLERLEKDLQSLVEGRPTKVPIFDFTRHRRSGERTVSLGDKGILVMEGLHALNDRLVGMIKPEQRFGLFVAPMTGVSLDGHNRTSTTDNRLLRRMVRDYMTRGYSPEETLKVWPSVIRGGNKYIFPYQQNADAMFNSVLFYELAVLKSLVEPLLRRIEDSSPVYGEAQRLLGILRFVPVLSAHLVPNNSVLREFIGGSVVAI